MALGSAVRQPRLGLLRRSRAQKPARLKPVYTELVYTYDQSGVTYRDYVAYDALVSRLPLSARYSPDFMRSRIIGVAIGGMAGWLLVLLVGYFALAPVLAALISVLGAIIGVGVGWLTGPAVGPQPFWIVRHTDFDPEALYRGVRAKLDGVEDDDEEPPDLPEDGAWVTGISHTHLYGMPRDIYHKLAQAIWAAENPDPEAEGDKATGNKNPGGLIAAGVAQTSYNPVVQRASGLWATLQMLDEKDKMRGPASRMQKIQTGAMVVMALASTGLLVFMWLTSSNP